MNSVEGVVTHVNDDVVHDPAVITRDPYKDGWVAMVKSPDLAINEKNLVQGPMIAPWMQNNITRLNGLLAQQSPALAQDGGLPLSGVLTQVEPELRRKIAKEFLLRILADLAHECDVEIAQLMTVAAASGVTAGAPVLPGACCSQLRSRS